MDRIARSIIAPFAIVTVSLLSGPLAAHADTTVLTSTTTLASQISSPSTPDTQPSLVVSYQATLSQLSSSIAAADAIIKKTDESTDDIMHKLG
jgi:hypothetical protein